MAKVVGQNPAAFLNDDSISIGLQMALFDVLGKQLGVPAHALLGKQLRQATPLSWWVQSASPADWAAECADAVAAGYTTCKLKARPWWDVVEQVAAVAAAVPDGFTLDLDFNTTLQSVAVAAAVVTGCSAAGQLPRSDPPIISLQQHHCVYPSKCDVR